MSDFIFQTQAQIRKANETGQHLRIQGAGSLSVCHPHFQGSLLSTLDYAGIDDIDESELLLEVKAGTSIQTLINALNEVNMMLPFDPIAVSNHSTIGGAVATSLSGYGASLKVSDSVLGVSILDGKGQFLEFGGKVLKNVTGFNVTALMVGSQGQLGVICDLKLRLLPRAKAQISLRTKMTASSARKLYRKLKQKPNPIQNSLIENGEFFLQLQASEPVLEKWETELAHKWGFNAVNFNWHNLNTRIFQCCQSEPIWQIRLEPETGDIANTLFETAGGAVRIVKQWDESLEDSIQLIGKRVLSTDENLKKRNHPPLNPIEMRIKTLFDPHHVFNQI